MVAPSIQSLAFLGAELVAHRHQSLIGGLLHRAPACRLRTEVIVALVVGIFAVHAAIDLHAFLLQAIEGITVDIAPVSQNRLGLA